MWIDERGSEMLGVPECRRLLAVGAKEHRHGHLGIPGTGAPLVLPVDYAVHGVDVVVRVGEGLFGRMKGRSVAFQVDGVSGLEGSQGTEGQRQWSVLMRGLAIEEDGSSLGTHVPVPRVVEPGHRVVRIRSDVITGRRFGLAPATAPGPGHPAL